MTEIELGSYVLFKDQMHMTPRGGILFPAGMGREDFEGLSDKDSDIDEYRWKGWGKINIGGAHVLKRCDGTHSVDEIMKELFADTYKESVGPVLSYLNAATANFNIDIQNSPFQGEPHVTGSLDYFHPLRILFEVTTRCNSHCSHCNTHVTPRAGDDIPTEELLSLLERLHSNGTRDVELTGGEPLLHPDFLDIFAFCVERFRHVFVVTNGLLVDEDLVEEFAIHTNVAVQVNIDGSSPESHDKRWGVTGAFEKALHASHLLVSQGVPRRIMITIGRDNVNEVEDIIQLVCELGIGGINYDFVRAAGRCRDLSISPCDSPTHLQKIKELISDKYKGIRYVSYEKERTEYSDNCGAGTTMLTVGPQGTIRPCPYLPEDYITGGTLVESEDFATGFTNPMSERFTALEFPGGDICTGCTFFDHCTGCFCNGVLMYEDIHEECRWGTHNKLEEWINFPHNSIE